jgi:hypothetical protein
LVSLSVASGDADPPGVSIAAECDSRTYEAEGLAPLAGLTVEGVRVGVVLYSGGTGEQVRASLWPAEPSRLAVRPGVVGARVLSYSAGRVDVELDGGLVLSGVPLWSAVGLVPEAVEGSRVLVLDLGDDPRATVAVAGAADGEASEVGIALEGSALLSPPAVATGRPVRFGDTIMMPSGSAATPTPTIVQGPPFPQPV